MQIKSIVHFVVVAALVVTRLFLPLVTSASIAVLYVRPGASGDCSSWSSACDLQTALSLASAGDEIWAAAGTYYPGLARTDTFTLLSGVALYGGFPSSGGDWLERDWISHPSILSGDIGVPNNKFDNSYHVVTGSGTDSTTILDGFTITAGYASDAGCGMYTNAGSPTLRNLLFTENACFATYGGGMYNLDSSPSLWEVTFNHNTANWAGGGMYNDHSSPTLHSVVFIDNIADKGGGMYNHFSDLSLSKVTFDGNMANGGGGMWNADSIVSLEDVEFRDNVAVAGGGGGLENWTNSQASLSRTVFTNNQAAGLGGGLDNYNGILSLSDLSFSGNSAAEGGGLNNNGTLTLSNATFSDNSASSNGGGMVTNTISTTLTNLTFTGNSAAGSGGAVYISASSPSLQNITITANSAASGGGIFTAFDSHPLVSNSILWGNTPSQIEGDPAQVTYSVIQGGYDGLGDETGNLDSDPLLLPLADHGGFSALHALSPGSPAIDAASLSECPPTDQRGILRPLDGDGDGSPRCDMGSFEWQNTPPAISAIPPLSTLEDNSTLVHFTISDEQSPPAGLALSAAASDPILLPAANLSFSGAGMDQTLHITPALDLSGAALITVTVSDGLLSASDTFSLTVQPVNDAPVLMPIEDRHSPSGVPVTFTVTAYDVDGDRLTFSLGPGAPAGAFLHPDTGVFSWTPHTGGVFTIIIRVEDPQLPPLSDEQQVTITIASTPPHILYIPFIAGSGQ